VVNVFYKAAMGSRQLRTLLTPVGGAVFLASVGTFIFLALRLDQLSGLPQLLTTPLHLIVSLPFDCMGIFLITWSLFHFIKAKGTPVPFNPPPGLVTTGPYAYSRNPMLTGIFILLFGLSMLLQSISLGFLFNPMFVAINVLELKTIEKPELEKRLGKDYDDYRKRTPMFIPRLSSLFRGRNLLT